MGCSQAELKVASGQQDWSNQYWNI